MPHPGASHTTLATTPRISTCAPSSQLETDAPVMVTKHGTLDALERIKNTTAKHNVDDMARVEAAISHYEPHIDFDLLLR